jgi:monoamine oxidase
VCEFDDEPHLYFNAGPARIPADHQRLLGYCRELGVPLEIFVNENRNAWIQDDRMLAGRPIRNREYVTDVRGFMSELLAKCVSEDALDRPFDGLDIDRVRQFASAFGDLDDDLAYHGSERAGIAGGGMITPAVHKDVRALSELLKGSFWRFSMNWGELMDQAAPMMQPVGGMDQVVAGFMRQVGHLVRLKSQVTSIRIGEAQDGVDVSYLDAEGTLQHVHADYCLNSMPSHILAGIDHNFPAPYRQALEDIGRGKLFKIGFQTKERFWERERIYGGISWTAQDITQIWYPGHGIHQRKGVILGAYTFNPDAGERFARMAPKARLEEAMRQGEKVHPNYRSHIETGVSVAWHRMNHMLGCAARWDEEKRGRYFSVLQSPAGNHFLIGDQVSYHPGWQEGALASALNAVERIDQRTRLAG